VKSSTRVNQVTAALLTRMSGAPSRAVVSSTSRVRSSGLDRSAAIATAVPPARLISATVWSIVPGKAAGAPSVVRAATATAAPAAPNRRAISAPIPRLAPVTRATFPSRTPIKTFLPNEAWFTPQARE
jgi:hypothetical protein